MNIGDNVSDTRQRPNGAILKRITARRLSNQIDRAHRGTFGAEDGLRTIVQLVAREMMRAGASPENVARAIEDHLVNHPAPSGRMPAATGTGHLSSKMLIELVQQCVDKVALE